MSKVKKILNTIGDSGCCCGEYKDENVIINTHCWRSHKCCPYSGVHYKIIKNRLGKAINREKALETVKRIATGIEEDYITHVTVTKRKML